MIGLVTEALTHDYPGGVRALDGVSLAIGPGETVGLIGQNGSGKTTLVRHFVGLLRPSVGRVLVDGRNAADLHVADLARLVGLAFQDPARQLFAGSVRAEVDFGPRNLGRRGANLESAVAEAVAAVGLAGRESDNPYDLGRAGRKRLAIAAVLAMGTPALILDEPNTGQDLAGRRLVAEIVASGRSAGRTTVVISHDLRFLAETCDRVIVMAAGRITADGTPNEVFRADQWPRLRETGLEPPVAATIGDRLGWGSTPTEASLLAALAVSGQ